MRLMYLIIFSATLACDPYGDASKSPFEGAWSGQWTATMQLSGKTTTQAGTMNITVDHNNQANGYGINNTINTSFLGVGEIDSVGVATLTYTYPTATYTGNGSVKIISSHLVGSFAMKMGGLKIGDCSIDLQSK